jgi:hypothetical protein
MVISEVCDRRLGSPPEPISDALAEHHGNDIRIGARAIRQDRGLHSLLDRPPLARPPGDGQWSCRSGAALEPINSACQPR